MSTKRFIQAAITATAAAGIAVVGTGVASAAPSYLTPPSSKAACESVLVSFKYPPTVIPTYENADDIPMTAGFWSYKCAQTADGRYSVVKYLASN